MKKAKKKKLKPRVFTKCAQKKTTQTATNNYFRLIILTTNS